MKNWYPSNTTNCYKSISPSTAPSQARLTWSHGLRNSFVCQQEHILGYHKHTGCEFVRQFGNSTNGTTSHEQHSWRNFPIKYNAHGHTIVITRRAPQTVDMYLGLRDHQICSIEHAWDIIERQLHHHPHAALTVPVLAQ
ncbi:hypothetical protein TNCV_3432401 [Trichonephila clavipes]|nr:hypothetical protein TNCV_3432401 [Trichonephila clavipes]